MTSPTVTPERSVEAEVRRRYWLVGALAGILALIVFVLILFHGKSELFRSEPLSFFYDL